MKRLSMSKSGSKQELLQLGWLELEPVCRNGVHSPSGTRVPWLCSSSFVVRAGWFFGREWGKGRG